jgi:DNA-binding SARP family transcriptional activator/predicted Zn-dependent protease/TolB-like protein
MTLTLDSSHTEATAPAGRFRLITLGQLALLRPDGSLETSLGVGGRKLAFLAYVALADRPLTRDHLVEIFWGDRDDDRARHSLREATSHVRRVLGAQSIPRGLATIALSDDAPLDIDLHHLLAMAKAGDHAAVLAAANGPFLDGVHLSDSRRFDEWLARERSRADRLVVEACRAEAERLEREGDIARWAAVATRWLGHSPLQAAAALSLLRARSASDTRDAIAQALDEYRRLTEGLARDYDATPDPEVARFASSLGERLSAATPKVVGTESHDGESTPPSAEPRRRRWRTRTSLVAASTFVLAAGLVGWKMAGARTDASARALVAVTSIQSLSADTADAWLESGVSQMLTMALSRAGTDVVAPERVRAAAVSQGAGAAARLGATLQVSGGITHGAGQYVLDLTLRSTAAGEPTPRAQFTVSAPDLVSVVDQATARIAAALDAPAAGPKLEDVETRSVVAYRSFVEGLERRAEGRDKDAIAAFDEAIAADSEFVSAVLERLLTSNENTEANGRLRVLARRLAPRAPEFDRMALESLDAFYAGDAERSESAARQLVARYPRDPRGYDRLITILSLHGRIAETEDVVRRRLALDSLAARSGGACGLCAGYAGLALLRLMAGAVPDAIAAARRAVTLQPQHPEAWAVLAVTLSAAGQFDEAIRAQSRAAALAPTDVSYTSALVRRQIEARRYDAADSVIRAWRTSAVPDRVSASADLEATLLRERGRYREAAATLEELLRREPDNGSMALLLGHTYGALGSVDDAARTFETLGGGHSRLFSEPDGGFSTFAGEAARAFAWPHALLADALYLAGSADTLRLAALADSVRAVGSRSYYARDWRLYHHIRGLIAMKGERWAEAEREFTDAEFTGSGWTRTNVELARAQLAQHRALDAIATLRMAYQASLDGMGRYAPRSEMDFLMARAFAAAGLRDSAAAYAGFARRAWSGADPAVKGRMKGGR